MPDCNGSCSSCNKDCSSRDLMLKQNSASNIKKIFAVVSGKGGVGKSSVTSMLASAMAKTGKSVAILDADITGPSIPKMFGITDKAVSENGMLVPAVAQNGIKLMSLNLLLETDETPVVWRGPVISGVIQQFFTDVAWGDVDYMFVDMPPGTGDVPLTVFQSLPVNGIIVVTTPQDLVSMIVAKAVNMANLMNVPVLGIVENMSWFECPNCSEKHFIFGQSKSAETAAKFGIELLAQLPINPDTAALADEGRVFDADLDYFDATIDKISN